MRYLVMRMGQYEFPTRGLMVENRIVSGPMILKKAKRRAERCPVKCVVVTARPVNGLKEDGTRVRGLRLVYDNKKMPFRLWGRPLMRRLEREMADGTA